MELYRNVSDDVIIQVEKEQKLKAPNVLHRYNEFNDSSNVNFIDMMDKDFLHYCGNICFFRKLMWK